MDLGAYAQIENLGKIMAENGISVPRLRGIRLMKDEKAATDEEIEANARYLGLLNCEFSVESHFQYDPDCFEICASTDRLKRKYIVYRKNENDCEAPVNIRWDKIHGRKRKLFKYELKNARKRIYAMYNTFNKYCGRDDVLYIHARIGGGNWPHYRKEVENEPWFIERVDCSFDSTYCDIYARIKPVKEFAIETTP